NSTNSTPKKNKKTKNAAPKAPPTSQKTQTKPASSWASTTCPSPFLKLSPQYFAVFYFDCCRKPERGIQDSGGRWERAGWRRWGRRGWRAAFRGKKERVGTNRRYHVVGRISWHGSLQERPVLSDSLW